MSKNSIWTADSTRRLFSLVAEARSGNRSLSQVFKTVAHENGVSIGTVRNYYYVHLHMFALLPSTGEMLGIMPTEAGKDFETFRDGEAESLVKEVLIRKAAGASVRSIVKGLAHGDSRKALRYQNKYRTIVFSQRARCEKLIECLVAEGKIFFHPYEKKISTAIVPMRNDEILAVVKELEKTADTKSVLQILTAVLQLTKGAAPQKNNSIEELRNHVAHLSRTAPTARQK